MERLMSRLPQPLFTVDFIPQRGGNVAQIEFGYINTKKANGNLHGARVNNSTGRWKVDDVSFTIGDPGNGALIPLNSSMIFGQYYLNSKHRKPEAPSLIYETDTGGSSRISVDPRILAYYYNYVPGAVLVNNPDGSIGYKFPCNSTLPDLTLNIGNGTVIYRSSLLNAWIIDRVKNRKSSLHSFPSHLL